MAARGIVSRHGRISTMLQALSLPARVICIGGLVTGLLITAHLMHFATAAVIVGEVTLLATFDTVHCLLNTRRVNTTVLPPWTPPSEDVSIAQPELVTTSAASYTDPIPDDLDIWRRFLDTLDTEL